MPIPSVSTGPAPSLLAMLTPAALPPAGAMGDGPLPPFGAVIASIEPQALMLDAAPVLPSTGTDLPAPLPQLAGPPIPVHAPDIADVMVGRGWLPEPTAPSADVKGPDSASSEPNTQPGIQTPAYVPPEGRPAPVKLGSVSECRWRPNPVAETADLETPAPSRTVELLPTSRQSDGKATKTAPATVHRSDGRVALLATAAKLAPQARQGLSVNAAPADEATGHESSAPVLPVMADPVPASMPIPIEGAPAVEPLSPPIHAAVVPPTVVTEPTPEERVRNAVVGSSTPDTRFQTAPAGFPPAAVPAETPSARDGAVFPQYGLSAEDRAATADSRVPLELRPQPHPYQAAASEPVQWSGDAVPVQTGPHSPHPGSPPAPPPPASAELRIPPEVARQVAQMLQPADSAQPGQSWIAPTDIAAEITTAAAPAPQPFAAPAATPVASALPSAPIDLGRGEWMQAMIDRIAELPQVDGRREAQIRLLPDALGAIEVKVTQRDNEMHVTLTADTAQARQMLTESAPRLHELAEARGLRFAHTDVGGGQSQDRRPASDQPVPQRPRSAAAKTSEDTSTAGDLIA